MAGFCNFVPSHIDFFKTQLIFWTFTSFPCWWIKLLVSLSIIWKHFDCFLLPSVGVYGSPSSCQFFRHRIAISVAFNNSRVCYSLHLLINISSLCLLGGLLLWHRDTGQYCSCFQRWPIFWSEEDNDDNLRLHPFTLLIWTLRMEMH